MGRHITRLSLLPVIRDAAPEQVGGLETIDIISEYVVDTKLQDIVSTHIITYRNKKHCVCRSVRTVKGYWFVLQCVNVMAGTQILLRGRTATRKAVHRHGYHSRFGKVAVDGLSRQG